VFEVIEPGDARWTRAVDESGADIFYRPEFARFRAEGQPHRPVMFHYEDALGRVFDVTTIREVSRLPFYEDVASTFRQPPIDLASPEYNGPIVAGERAGELRARYRAAVDGWCRQSGVVTEFVRVHPFAEGVDASLPVASEVIAVDLREGYEAAARRYRKGHRGDVRKASRDGARIAIVEPDEARVARFASLYLETMERRQAKSVYRFQPEYFASMFRHLGSRAILAEAHAGTGSLAAMAVFFVGGAHVWYMYNAAVESESGGGVITLMLDRLFAWAAERGCSWFMLGGGFQPGDGLYRFKMGFSQTALPVRHIRHVHDADAYQRLIAAKNAHDARHGRSPGADYFPSYWL
jgi:hypothetical protein